MKTKYGFIIIVLYLCIIYTISAENEVQVIENTSAPILGKLKLKWTEEVVFDCAELDAEYNIYYIQDMVVNSEDNVLVLAGSYVFKINPSGELLKSFRLKKGQGPGEIQQYASSFQLDSADNIYIKDGFRVVMFDNDMNFIKNIHLGLHSSLFIDHKGFLYAMKHVHSDEGRTKVLTKFDQDGNVIREFDSYNDGKLHKGPGGGITSVTRHHYSPHSMFLLNSDNHIIYSINLEYKLKKIDLEGNLVSTIKVDEKPYKISSNEKKAAIEEVKKTVRSNYQREWNLDFPDHRPFIKILKCDEKGRIYIFRLKSILDEDQSEIVDILSKDGRYLYQERLPFFQRSTLPNIPKIIWKGSIYFPDYREKDELGVSIPKIKRLVIKDYDSLQFR